MRGHNKRLGIIRYILFLGVMILIISMIAKYAPQITAEQVQDKATEVVEEIKDEVTESIDAIKESIPEQSEMSDRDKRVVNTEAGGTDIDGFMRVGSDKAVLYEKKGGAVLGELSKGDYVYVHIMYDDGFVYSGQLQGYLKAEDLVKLSEYVEEPTEFKSTLVEPPKVNDFEELETYRLSMPSAGIDVDCVYVLNKQENVDIYDVVQAKGLSFIRLNGHNTRSLKKLHKVKVGDEFTYNGVSYLVTFSGTGVVNESWQNIICDATGEEILCSSDIEIITCHNTWLNSMNRWVVLAEAK